MQKITKIVSLAVAVFAIAIVPATATFAQSATTDVTQTINAGSLTAAVLDASRVPVGSPSFAMTATGFSFDCQTATGTMGSGTQRIYIVNPSATSGQSWTLTINGTGPEWTDGGDSYDFDDPTGSGCTNGQLTLDPSSGTATLTDDCTSTECTTATVTQGSADALDSGTPVTLLSAATDAATVYRGYLTGIGLSQEIPGETPAGNYTLPMTITATAS